MAKDKKEKKIVFTAKLRLRDIGPKVVTYRVHDTKGLAVDGLTHLQIPRVTQGGKSQFPVDSDFNLGFINSDLPTVPTKHIPKSVIDAMKKKQDAFRDIMEFDVVVR